MNKTSKLAVLAVVVMACVPESTEPDRVETIQGMLRGRVLSETVAFLGVPFAEPPIGDLRWRAPRPPSTWDGVRDAVEYGPSCAQAMFPGIEPAAPKSEDCLYLNVWTPLDRGDEALPVMFWIHDGGFVNGSAADPMTDGTAFAKEGVVLVSANYRLGWFGVFAHPALTGEGEDDERLANFNLLDQIAALHWIQDNIAAFGGDPDRVTIFGNSAGGISVQALMVSPLATGLFSGAIVQSGSIRMSELPILSPSAEQSSAEMLGKKFAERHGITGDGDEALAALRALPTEEVVDGLHMGTIASRGFPFLIVGGRVVPQPSEVAFQKGLQAPVPLIVGATDADGFYPFFRGSRDDVFAPFGEYRDEAEALYDPDGDGDLFRYGTWAGADIMFLEPARYHARSHAENGHPTWAYRFSYVKESLRDRRFGAWHASEKPFLFGTLSDEPTSNDLEAGDQLRAYWTAFARTGRPAPEGLPEWPHFDPEQDVLLEFLATGPTVHPDPARSRLDLAEKLAGNLD